MREYNQKKFANSLQKRPRRAVSTNERGESASNHIKNFSPRFYLSRVFANFLQTLIATVAIAAAANNKEHRDGTTNILPRGSSGV